MQWCYVTDDELLEKCSTVGMGTMGYQPSAYTAQPHDEDCVVQALMLLKQRLCNHIRAAVM